MQRTHKILALVIGVLIVLYFRLDVEFGWPIRSRNKVALYVTYCGSSGGLHDVITPAFSEIPCFFLTDNVEVLRRAVEMGWTGVLLESVQYTNTESGDYGSLNNVSYAGNMKCKKYRTMPHRVQELNQFDTLVYIDTKALTAVNFSRISPEVNRLLLPQHANKVMAFNLHPLINRTVQQEFSASMGQERYAVDREKYKRLIDQRLSEGLKGDVVLHSGFIIRRMRRRITAVIGEQWYDDIIVTGPECQISLSFIYEKFKERILITESPVHQFAVRACTPHINCYEVE